MHITDTTQRYAAVELDLYLKNLSVKRIRYITDICAVQVSRKRPQPPKEKNLRQGPAPFLVVKIFGIFGLSSAS
jgi:hypothetical protein